MTQGPWSVKGIAPEARAAARQRAERRGLTLGQYLNSLLLDDEEDEAPATNAEKASPIHPPKARKIIVPSDRPDELRELSEEIERLSARLEISQSRSARAVAGLDKSMLGLMGKVDESGRAQLGAVEKMLRAIGEIEGAQSALKERIATLEEETTGGATLENLQLLEGALKRLAETVQARANSLEREQGELRDLFEDRVRQVSDQVEGVTRTLDDSIDRAVRANAGELETRLSGVEGHLSDVERKMDGALGRITDAANRFEMFESKADRTVADTTWRMERALETTLSRSRAMSKDLIDRVDSIEEKTREAVGKLGDSVSRIIDRIDRSERDSEAALKSVERSVSGIDDRLNKLSQSRDSESDRMQATFQRRLDALAEDLSRPMHAVREDFERRLEEALRTHRPEQIERLEKSFRTIQGRLETAEARQADVVDAMSEQIGRLSRAVDDRLRKIEAGDVGGLAQMRSEVESLAGRLGAGEDAVSRLRDDMGRLGTSLETRVRESETRSAKAIETASEQFGAAVERVQARAQESIEELNRRLEAEGRFNADEFEKFIDRIDERVRDSERRSADAISQIGEQVARVAERLQNQHRDSLKAIEDRVEEAGRNHESRLQETLSDMTRRLDELSESSAESLNPLHNTVSSLARRVSDLEDVNPSGDDDGFDTLEAVATLTVNVADAGSGPPEADGEPTVLDILEEDEGVIGVEPPPFDPVSEQQLFDESEPADITEPEAIPAIVEKADKTAPTGDVARDIDDLLDADDVFLESGEPGDIEFLADLPDPSRGHGSNHQFIQEARNAARYGRHIPMATMSDNGRKGIGRGPLMASAALAIAVAGGGAWSMMRGKQDPGADTVARHEPSTPLIDSGDPAAAEAALFDDDTATNAAPAAPGVETADAGAGEPQDDMFEEIPLETKAAAALAETIPEKPATTAPAAQPVEPPRITLADAVESGDPIALYDYGLEMLKGPEKTRAVSLIREAAGKGLVMAQYRMAKLYEDGTGVPRDMAASRKWTEQAAIGGNVKAMHDLAVFYAEGDAGPQSYAAAVEWFRQAADHGLIDSQFNLAVLYEQGLGVTADPAEAAYWFEIASRGGDQDAGRRARALLSELPQAEADDIRKRARSFAPKKGVARANGDLGERAWTQPG
ncbi:MAG: hypothetical protein R3C52_04750 [Hyphomonadaceae bacterium]